MHYGASESEVADCTATTSNCIIYSRATQTGGGCIGSRRAVLAFVLARAGRAMLTTITSSSDGSRGRLVANDETSWGRLITCPLYPYWP